MEKSVMVVRDAAVLHAASGSSGDGSAIIGLVLLVNNFANDVSRGSLCSPGASKA